MKRFVSLFLVLLCVTGAAFAQSLKFGHINKNELIGLMPERDSVLVKLQNYVDEMDATISEMQQEWTTKYNTYQQKQATWTAAVLESKTRELQNIQASLEQIQQTAQQEYQQMQQVLFAPVISKAEAAIEKVAKNGAFSFVFDLSAMSLAYYDQATSTDLLPLVKAELGIPAEKVAPTQLTNEQLPQ